MVFEADLFFSLIPYANLNKKQSADKNILSNALPYQTSPVFVIVKKQSYSYGNMKVQKVSQIITFFREFLSILRLFLLFPGR